MGVINFTLRPICLTSGVIQCRYNQIVQTNKTGCKRLRTWSNRNNARFGFLTPGVAEGSGHMECDVAVLGEWVQMLRRTSLPARLLKFKALSSTQISANLYSDIAWNPRDLNRYCSNIQGSAVYWCKFYSMWACQMGTEDNFVLMMEWRS